MTSTDINFPVRLLVIAGESPSRRELANLLSINNYQVQVIGHGYEGLGVAKHIPPDLILLDVKLSDTDGYAIAKQLQVHAVTAHVPIILLAESKSVFREIRTLNLQVADVLIYPLDCQEAQWRMEKQLLSSPYRRDKLTNQLSTTHSLKSVNHQLKILIDNSPLGTIIWDKNFRVIQWSKQAEQIFGWSESEVFGKSMNEWKFIFEEDSDRVNRETQKLFENQETRRICRNHNYRKDGSVIYCEWYNSNLYDESGKLNMLLSWVQDISDRHQTELALAASEKRFQEIASTISQFFFVKLADSGQYIYVSPAYEKIWGRTCESLYKNPDSWLDAIHPEDREWVINSLKKQHNNNLIKREYRIMRDDGVIRWIYAEVNIIYNPDGSPLRYVGFAEDISDRKQAELALAESEELLRLAVNHAPDVFVIYDSDRRLKFVNQRALERTGWSEETFIGRRDEELFPPEVTSHYLPLLEKTIQTLTIQMGEATITLPNQTPKTVIIKYLPLLDKQGKLSQILGLTFDITHYKQAEQKLRDSEERFRTAFEDAAIGMGLLSPQGNWLKVNRSMCEMLGYQEAELLQLKCKDVTHPEDYQRELKSINQLVDGQVKYYYLEKRYLHKQGYVIWVLLSMSLVRNIDGLPLYFIAQAQNISERRAVEQMKNEFISVVSHELRTPLTAIQGSLGLLSSGLYDHKPQEFHKFIEIALLETERLVRLVNDILDIERLNSGEVQFQMEACSAQELMMQVINSLQAIAHQDSITLEILPTSAQLWAARDAILQTLTNLVGNAIKFSPPHTAVNLSAYPQDDMVLFQVRDQGRGIPPEKLETIFSRFQQVDASDSRQKGGTGLGLSICQSIIEQHGGKIWVESQLAKGSTFYFTIPRVINTNDTNH
ncbi:MAG: PAS domain S-box protein [Arthrospira sp. SH-MAG29]|nr:PAS domain S-box protein [Arthrospira sp. SH-MAG29]MBS0017679.1 PAS domain S-box protein [Arthrospira sp. SH-MAG29]